MTGIPPRKKLIIPTNETGHTIGEKHHRAKLTDRQCELMQFLHEDFELSYKKLAWIFGVTKGYVRDVCTYRRRSCTAMGYRVVLVEDRTTVQPMTVKLP